MAAATVAAAVENETRVKAPPAVVLLLMVVQCRRGSSTRIRQNMQRRRIWRFSAQSCGTTVIVRVVPVHMVELLFVIGATTSSVRMMWQAIR